MIRRLLLVVLLALTAAQIAGPLAAPARAQTATTSEGLDYTEWKSVSERAEAAVTAGAASTGVLEDLRAELADWRTRFLSAQGLNASRIANLNEQIAALGPAPAEGETETDEIAARRVELNQQLRVLRAPVLRAEEAYIQADGLISEIDTIVRERQANRLTRRDPSPVLPDSWQAGFAALQGTTSTIAGEVTSSWTNNVKQAERKAALPAIGFFLLVALVLLARGRFWAERLTLGLVGSADKAQRSVLVSLVSLGQIIVPMVGVLALLAALHEADLLSAQGGQVARMVPTAALFVLLARWLGNRIFPKLAVRGPVFELPAERKAEGRWYSTLMGVVLALAWMLNQVADADDYAPAARAVLNLPLLVTAGLLLYRIARLLRLHVRLDTESAEDTRVYRNSIIRLVIRLTLLVAVVGPLAAILGYTEAATALVYPAMATLWLLGLLMLLQRFIFDLWTMIAQNEESGDSVIPVLLGLVLSFSALPLLALIWGARVADLTELWTTFTDGFQMGDSRIRPADFLTFALVFGVLYTATRLFQGTLRTQVLPRTKIDTGGQKAIVSGLGYVGIFLAGVISITSAGIDLSSLAIVAGALSVGIGFGLQNIVSNFVSGIILLIERPVSEGDWIEVGNVMGTVRNISVRSTRIETFDRTDVIVPNTDLISGVVTNWTRQNLTGRIILTVGVSYGTDTRKVEAILREIAEAHPLVIVNPPPQVVFQGFGADSLDFEIRAILRDITFGLPTRTELNHQIAARFAEEGIEIPFAQRDIWLRNPEALAPPPAPARAPQPAPDEPDTDTDTDAEGAEDGV
ncbi:DUF3772 domain-containing protein [Actibacterium ureilyticum]|uniref:DUF3772 domain-containing protein n=1 Tax=Actibacterium ureilyticum TaxID=1590614 RepID=UPI000BAA9D34|nr:DUF3772 domain-containing protein [Actibacterium ureilyticum]